MPMRVPPVARMPIRVRRGVRVVVVVEAHVVRRSRAGRHEHDLEPSVVRTRARKREGFRRFGFGNAEALV